MEYRGQDPRTLVGTIHGPGYSGGGAITQTHTLAQGGFNLGFHVFAIDWDETSITWMRRRLRLPPRRPGRPAGRRRLGVQPPVLHHPERGRGRALGRLAGRLHGVPAGDAGGLCAGLRGDAVGAALACRSLLFCHDSRFDVQTIVPLCRLFPRDLQPYRPGGRREHRRRRRLRQRAGRALKTAAAPVSSVILLILTLHYLRGQNRECPKMPQEVP